MKKIISFIREVYGVEGDFIPLHIPTFRGNEKEYLNECIKNCRLYGSKTRYSMCKWNECSTFSIVVVRCCK